MRMRLARVVTVVLLAGSGVVGVPALGSAQQAEVGEQNDVRIVARHSSTDRVEFGLQQRRATGGWDVRLLPARRFFPVDTAFGRWLASSPLVLQVGSGDSGEQEVDVRIAAQRSSSGRIEFALQQQQPDGTWGERLLPARRFFPVGTALGRWLASSPVVLQVDAAGDGAEPDATPQVTEATVAEEPPAEEPPAEEPPAEDPPNEEPSNEEPPAEDPPAEEPPARGPQTGAVTVSNDVPNFNMTDVQTGGTVNLRSVVNGATPLLFWLWSPY